MLLSCLFLFKLICKEDGNKKNTYTQNQKEIAEEGWLGKLNTHRAYWGQEWKEKIAGHLPDMLVWMDGGMGMEDVTKG